MGNYRAFIAAADALLAIRKEVSSIDKHLESLVFYAYLVDVNVAGVNVRCCLVLSLCFFFFSVIWMHLITNQNLDFGILK